MSLKNSWCKVLKDATTLALDLGKTTFETVKVAATAVDGWIDKKIAEKKAAEAAEAENVVVECTAEPVSEDAAE